MDAMEFQYFTFFTVSDSGVYGEKEGAEPPKNTFQTKNLLYGENAYPESENQIFFIFSLSSLIFKSKIFGKFLVTNSVNDEVTTIGVSENRKAEITENVKIESFYTPDAYLFLFLLFKKWLEPDAGLCI